MNRTALGLKFIFLQLLVALSMLAMGCSGGTPDDDPNEVGKSTRELCGTVTTTVTPSRTGSVGQSFTFNSTPGGCVQANPQVRIDHLRPGSSTWQIDRDWSSTTSWVWNTSTSNGGSAEPAGWHIFHTLVREAGGATYEAYTTFDVNLRPVFCSGGGTTAGSPSAARVGETVTLNSTAAGCGAAEYRIDHLRPGSSSWQMDSAYSSANSAWVWNTATANGGNRELAGWHTFHVLIRAVGSSQPYESVVTYAYYLSAPRCSGITAAATPGSGTVGQTIAINSSATGCPTAEYRIDHLRPGSSVWETDSGYASSNSSYSWNTATARGGFPELPGWHTFHILVRAQGSGLAFDTYYTVAVNLTLPKCNKVTSSASPTSGAAGVQVTLSSSATGCGVPEYRIDHLRPGGSTWQTDSLYSPLNSSWTWDSSTESTGWHYFHVLARQQGSTAAYDSYSTVSFYLSASAACSTASVSFSPASPATVGTNVRVDATASGCTYPTFRYEYQAPGSSTWTLLQDWTSSNFASWNTNLAAVGTYNVRVLARAAGSTAPSQAIGSDTYVLNAPSTSAGTAIVGGAFHMCELTSTGKVACWGYNGEGQLGSSTGGLGLSTTPLTVSGVAGIDIAAGSTHTCAVVAGGAVNCWGQNHVGQLGNGGTTNSTTPVAVSGITNAVGVGAGAGHTCAVLANGGVRCWGYNSQGQLGDGTGVNRTVPVTVPGITTARQVSAGYYNTCVLLADGTVRCWGANPNGELGNGSNTRSFTPVAVSGLNNVVSISSAYYGTCALRSDHTVWCWGANTLGELGDGTTTSRSAPVQVSSITTAVAIAKGGSHGCAALQNGTAVCWGRNSNGQLGNGTTTNSTTPVPVSTLTTVTSVAASDFTSCALLSNGGAACWGYGSDGNLGNGWQSTSAIPVTVSAIP